jgi:protein-disulfide isomerase
VKRCLRYTLVIVILSSVGFSLVLFGQRFSTQHSDSSDQRVVATVGTQSITLLEAERNVALPLYALDQQRARLIMYSVQQLIDEELLRTEAKRTGQTVEELLNAPHSSLKSDASHPRVYDEPPLDKAMATSQRRQTVITALRRQNSIRLDLPRITEPILTVSADDDPSAGPSAAPVTIVEFSDFQCPFCKLSAGVLKEVLRAYGDKVRLVYRDYPAPNHIHAGKAAEAAQCAAAQGKFWAYHDLLFEYQQAAGSGWDFIQLAQQTSIDLTEFTRCLNTHQYALEVENDLRDGLSLGVRSTPTFFVNGRPLIGARSFDEFKQLIDRVLAET